MPASHSASATRSDSSGSSELITRDRVSTVTPKPRRSAASATSMPTYPPPTITTCAPGLGGLEPLQPRGAVVERVHRADPVVRRAVGVRAPRPARSGARRS